MESSRRENAQTEFVALDIDEIMRRRADTRKGLLYAAGSAICSGVNLPILKLLMVWGNWTPTENYFVRAACLFVVIWTMRLFLRRWSPGAITDLRRLPRFAWLSLLASGAVGNALSGVLFSVCIQRFAVSVVTPITASSPLMTVILSRIFFKERLSKIQNAGVLLVIVGSVSVSL
jgi:drug/metabolite transporter (DMT)-like permease